MKIKMKRTHILAVAALIGLVAVLALPAAALAPATGTEKAGINPGLKEELWNIHTAHRLVLQGPSRRKEGKLEG
jgi:hypothetical protein